MGWPGPGDLRLLPLLLDRERPWPKLSPLLLLRQRLRMRPLLQLLLGLGLRRLPRLLLRRPYLFRLRSLLRLGLRLQLLLSLLFLRPPLCSLLLVDLLFCLWSWPGVLLCLSLPALPGSGRLELGANRAASGDRELLRPLVIALERPLLLLRLGLLLGPQGLPSPLGPSLLAFLVRSSRPCSRSEDLLGLLELWRVGTLASPSGSSQSEPLR